MPDSPETIYAVLGTLIITLGGGITGAYALIRILLNHNKKQNEDYRALMQEQFRMERDDNKTERERQWAEQTKINLQYQQESVARTQQANDMITSLWALQQKLKIGFTEFVKAQQIWEGIDTKVDTLPAKIKQDIDDTMSGTSDLLLQEFQKIHKQLAELSEMVQKIPNLTDVVERITRLEEQQAKLLQLLQDNDRLDKAK